ncbi:MAG: XdhC family protein [Candidatus Hydrogenedentales bacterium]
MDIYRKALEIVEGGRRAALGLVVHAQGSTPQKVGSKALIDDSGRQWGTLGGGMVEAHGLERMRHVLAARTADAFEFRLDERYRRDAGPICGGVMRIWAMPLTTEMSAAFREAAQALARRERGVLITSFQTDGSVQTRWARESSWNGAGDLPAAEELRRVLAGERPELLTVGDADARLAGTLARPKEHFVEPVAAPPRLLIVGGGHVGQAVAHQATLLGFDITVYDDRAEFAQPELFPAGVRAAAGDLRQLVSEFPQDHDTYIVLVSKGHRPDAEALEGCIHGNAAYMGMIGSKRKIRFLRKHFLDDGLATAAEFDRVVAPIGLDIGAVTVPEIGVSIAAQLIAARRRNRTDGGSLHAQFHHGPAPAL